jgi:hypothetical protein
MTLRARLQSPWTWLWVALAVALVVRAGVRDRGVIADHLEFGRRLLLGLDLYAPYLDPGPLHAPYPPSFGLWTAPFWALGERAARWLWAALQVLALWRIGGLLRATQLVWLVTLLIASRYVLRDLHGGGGNTFQLLFALEACALAAAGRARLAGWVLGFGLATKPTQALLVPYLWLCGQRRAAMHALLASTAFAGFALLLHGGGLEPWRRWLEGTFAYATQQDLFAEPAHGWPAFTWMNQCLGARAWPAGRLGRRRRAGARARAAGPDAPTRRALHAAAACRPRLVGPGVADRLEGAPRRAAAGVGRRRAATPLAVPLALRRVVRDRRGAGRQGLEEPAAEPLSDDARLAGAPGAAAQAPAGRFFLFAEIRRLTTSTASEKAIAK